MISRDKLKVFANQTTDRDAYECVALSVVDIAGNILGQRFSNDFTYAATIFLEGAVPGDQGTNPLTGFQSAVAYGLLPLENAPFTSETMGEQYVSNWENYSPVVRKLALLHQLPSYKSLGADYDLVVRFMQTTGQGVALPVTWFASFSQAPSGQLPLPSGETSDHCLVAYLGDDNETIWFKAHLGATWGQQGYAVLTRQMFNTIVSDALSFDMQGSHWYAMLAILCTKYPYLYEYLPALSTIE